MRPWSSRPRRPCPHRASRASRASTFSGRALVARGSCPSAAARCCSAPGAAPSSGTYRRTRLSRSAEQTASVGMTRAPSAPAGALPCKRRPFLFPPPAMADRPAFLPSPSVAAAWGLAREIASSVPGVAALCWRAAIMTGGANPGGIEPTGMDTLVQALRGGHRRAALATRGSAHGHLVCGRRHRLEERAHGRGGPGGREEQAGLRVRDRGRGEGGLARWASPPGVCIQRPAPGQVPFRSGRADLAL